MLFSRHDMETLKIDNVTVYLCAIPGGDGSRRERERMAVNSLVEQVFPGCKLGHKSSGAPFIDIPGVYVSVSHSRNYAALAVSEHTVGIDIEEPRAQQLERVVTRFMSDADLKACPNLLDAWTAKEAVFKAAGVDDAMLADISFETATLATLGTCRFAIRHHPRPPLTIAIAQST